VRIAIAEGPQRRGQGWGNLLFDEVEDNCLSRQLVRAAKGLGIRPAGTFSLILGVGLVGPVNLNVAIVLGPARQGGRDGLAAPDPPETMGGCQAGRLNQDIVDVRRAAPGLENGWDGQGGIKTINVPVERTEAAGNDGSDLGSGLLAVVAQHGLAILALFEKVRHLFVAALTPRVEETCGLADVGSRPMRDSGVGEGWWWWWCTDALVPPWLIHPPTPPDRRPVGRRRKMSHGDTGIALHLCLLM
jgi:hypothetical protein